MTTIKYTLNKRDLKKDERDRVSKYYRGLSALSDTLTETTYDDNGNRTGESTYFIFKGSWTPYGSCVKHNGRYVIARWSRYDSISEDFTDYAIDCDEKGSDDMVFETKHFEMKDMKVQY